MKQIRNVKREEVIILCPWPCFAEKKLKMFELLAFLPPWGLGLHKAAMQSGREEKRKIKHCPEI